MYGRNRPVAWRNRPEAWRTGGEPKRLHTIETSGFKSACPRCKIVDKCIAICLLMDQFITFKEDFEFSMDYVLVWANKARIFMKLWPKKTDFPDHARDFPSGVLAIFLFAFCSFLTSPYIQGSPCMWPFPHFQSNLACSPYIRSRLVIRFLR